MTLDFFTILILGTIKDPILWILSTIIASNILVRTISKKLLYLFLSGLLLGFIRLHIYKSFGEIFTSEQAILLIFTCIILMIATGKVLLIFFNYFKTKT